MRIAIPVADGKLAAHFGHCEKFALIDVDEEKKEILANEMTEAPPHQPGLLPVWLDEIVVFDSVTSAASAPAAAQPRTARQTHGLGLLPCP